MEAARPGPAEGQIPDQAAGERGPDGRKLTAKQRLSKRGRPGPEEPPKSDAAQEEPAAGEAAKEAGPRLLDMHAKEVHLSSGRWEGIDCGYGDINFAGLFSGTAIAAPRLARFNVTFNF